MSAAQLVWATWHRVPFDNAAMTNAVVALRRADPDAEIAALREANAELLAELRSIAIQGEGDLSDVGFRRYVCEEIVAKTLAKVEGATK